MTIKSGIFNSVGGDRRYKAEDFASYFATFIGNGIFPNPSTGFQVIANGNMTVSLKPGKAWINGYYIINDDNHNLTIDASDSALNRIDRIVLQLNYFNRTISPVVKKGTYATSPVAPTLKRDADAYELALADVQVNKGALEFTQSNITDLRLNNSLCGIVHGVVDQVDTTSIFNQYQSWFNNYSVTKAQEFEIWKTNVTTALELWISNEKADFVSWRNAEEELYNSWLQGKKSNFDSWFATITNILDSNAAGNLQLQIDQKASQTDLTNANNTLTAKITAHVDEEMPHKYKDTITKKTYKWGMGSENGIPYFIREEIL